MAAYAVKVRKHGERVFYFLNGKGGTTHLRMHTSQWLDVAECERFARSVASEIGTEYDVKIVEFGKSAKDYKAITECAPVKRGVKPAFELLEGSGAGEEARRRARIGHKKWITWLDKDGGLCAARMSHASLKAALLASGTQGKWILYDGDSCGMVMRWQNGVAHLRWMKTGHYRY